MVEGTVKISDGLCEFAKESGCHILCVGADEYAQIPTAEAMAASTNAIQFT